MRPYAVAVAETYADECFGRERMIKYLTQTEEVSD